MIALHRRTREEIRCRTAARHDETPSESGCIFAAALIVVLVIIFITPALLP